MGGFLGGDSAATTEPALAGIKIQTSVYGMTIPVGYGRNKIAGNLLWYNNFRSVPQEQRSESGKGGGAPVQTSYSYLASVIMGLGEGLMGNVRKLWIGKEVFTGVAQALRPVDAQEVFGIPGSPFIVTVTHSADYANPVHCIIKANGYDDADIILVEGIDYTRVGGAYTFLGTYWGRNVDIAYQYNTTTDAQSALESVGLSIKPGVLSQSVWPFLSSNYPSEALGYSGLAYVYAQDYPINNAAQLENHNFEVDFQLQYSPSVPDCDPSAVIKDVLFNPKYSVQFPSSQLDDMTAFSTYALAAGLLISPVYDSQQPGRDVLNEICDACNADPCWTGSKLRIVPRGDASLTGNGVTYTPNNTPVFSVGPDDFVSKDMEPVVKTVTDPADRYNRVTVEYQDRANNYVTTPCEAKDESAQRMYGLRAEDTQGWKVFANATAAQQSANIRLQRYQAAISKYEFTLPWRFLQLELGDLLLLNEPTLHLVNEVVKVLEITESDTDGSFDIVAESFPIGHANAPIYAPQNGSGFAPNMNIDPGSVQPPFFFEPPGSSVEGSGLAVSIAATGSNPYWGGADVYISLNNGASYKFINRISHPARIGTLQATMGIGSTATMDIILDGRGGQLFTTSDYDADALTTLCFVGDTLTGEYMAFKTANFVAANHYQLTDLRRGRYGSAEHSGITGTRMVYIDGAVIQSDALNRNMIGTTLKFKFCSFNIFGGALQSLASAPEYSYKLTGRFMDQTGKPISANMLANATFDAGLGPIQFFWGGGSSGGDTGGVNELLVPGGTSPLRIPGSPSNIQIAQIGTASAYQFIVWPAVAVNPLKRYVGFADLVCHRAGGYVTGWWLDSTGTIIGSAVPGANVIATDNTKSPAASGDYRTSSFFATPPANAVAFRFIVIKNANDAGQTSSGIYVHKPFFGVALPEQTELPVWEAGGSNTVGENQIALGATYDIKTYPQPGSIPVALNGTSRSLIAASETIGPFNVATKIIVSGTSSFTYGGPGCVPGTSDGPRLYLQVNYGGAVDGPADYAPPIAVADQYHYYKPFTRDVIDLPAGASLTASLYAAGKPWHISCSAASSRLDIEITKLR